MNNDEKQNNGQPMTDASDTTPENTQTSARGTVHPPERNADQTPDQILTEDASFSDVTEETDEPAATLAQEMSDDGENAINAVIDAEQEAERQAVEDEKDKEMPTETEAREQVIENVFECLIGMLDDRHYADFRRELAEMNPVDVADFFEELPTSRIPAVFKLLDKTSAADVFAEMDVDTQERIITAMSDREISVILEDLALDDAVDMLEELPASIVYRIMKNATPETRAGINRLLAYPEDSAGSVMTAEFLDLRRRMTCEQAIEHIRRTGLDKETVYVAYVTDESRVLQGIVPLKSLLFARPDELVDDIMEEDIICASTLDDQETVANIISKYDMLALPIVDTEHRLVGIVTVDDAMDVMETEATEDIEKMAAIVPTDKPYLKTGVFETFRKRIPWLLLLMVSATFTSTILGHFEASLAALPILTVFVPMLMDTGGNAGGQTSVTIIRGLSLGEIELGDVLRILWKEIRVALLCGATVGVACFAKTMIVDFKFAFAWENIRVSLVVCLTMVCAILFAKMVGTLLPIGAKRLGFDPAVMASPFITTIVDTLTLLIYFAIAAICLGI